MPRTLPIGRRAPGARSLGFFEAQRRHRQLTATWIAIELVVLWTLVNVLIVPLRIAAGGQLAPDPSTMCAVALAVSAFLASAVAVARWRVLAAPEVLEADGPDSRALREVVAQMSIASGMPAPAVHVVDDPAPNAYAVAGGRGAIVCTTGLLALLDRRELTGVVAHELAHLRNRDSTVIWTATFGVGLVVALAGTAASFAHRGARRRPPIDPRTGRPGNALTLRELDQEALDRRCSRRFAAAFALAMWMVARPAALLVRAGVSRRREELADASAVQFTRDPGGLRSALEKIAAADVRVRSTTVLTAALWIAPPAPGPGALRRLLDAHPPIERRIAWLRSLESSGQVWTAPSAA